MPDLDQGVLDLVEVEEELVRMAVFPAPLFSAVVGQGSKEPYPVLVVKGRDLGVERVRGGEGRPLPLTVPT